MSSSTYRTLQGAASATYQLEVMGSSQMYVTGVYQHVGSRFTQVGDEDLGTLDLNSLPNAIGGPLTKSTFGYDPELPAYDLLNLRVGMRRADWDVAAYVNNVTNERALLSFDRERGTLARIGRSRGDRVAAIPIETMVTGRLMARRKTRNTTGRTRRSNRKDPEAGGSRARRSRGPVRTAPAAELSALGKHCFESERFE